MALRARAFSTNDTENVVNPLQAKRGLQTSRGKKKASEFLLDSAHFNFFLLGTSNLQRSAFGELKNTTNRSASVDDKAFKEPLKPALNRAPKARDHAANLKKSEQMESMDISNNEMDTLSVESEPEIEDIDVEDAGNPQLVVEYVNDIYNYLRSDLQPSTQG